MLSSHVAVTRTSRRLAGLVVVLFALAFLLALQRHLVLGLGSGASAYFLVELAESQGHLGLSLDRQGGDAPGKFTVTFDGLNLGGSGFLLHLFRPVVVAPVLLLQLRPLSLRWIASGRGAPLNLGLYNGRELLDLLLGRLLAMIHRRACSMVGLGLTRIDAKVTRSHVACSFSSSGRGRAARKESSGGEVGRGRCA